MEQYLDNAPCLYFSSLDDGTIINVNTTLCRKLGYTKEELEGQKLDTIFTIPTRIFQQTHFFPLLKMQGWAEEIYITLQTRSGEQLPLLINAERKIEDNKAISVYVGIVVLNRKRFEDELVRVVVDVEDTPENRQFFAALKPALLERFNQLEIYIASHPIDIL